ncbi:MAG TPA: DUF2461 domain-containing protein [Polyangiaceae bacterium]|jgi:uncharacterized protein (TIGR02453 family)
MPFEGFADANVKFFRALAKHQNREWFQAHKAEFETGYQAPLKALLEDVSEAVDKALPHCDLDEPKVFRIYRDVRFSKDKAPYKTHIGGVIPVKRTGKMTEVPMALYFHVGQPKYFGAAGHYMMDPGALAGYRRAVADDKRGRELERILASVAKKGFSVDSHGAYKRVPKGFDADHPRAEHLKRQGLTVGFPEIPKALLTSPKLVGWVGKQAKVAAPLVEWLVFATL